MAYRITNGAGTSFNSAANWDEGINTPSIHASTSITVTAGGVTSATFTAPNTTNKCTGVLVPVAAKGTAGNIIATLQEDAGAGFVDVAGATATIAITSLVASTHVLFYFTTAYTFTTTAAGKYRIKLNTSGASGTTSIAADSGGANFAYLAYMNNNVVPTTGDDIHVVSKNQGAALTIDLDTSPSIGSGTNTSVPTFRSWGNAIVYSNNGTIAWQTGTSRTLTHKGNILVESGGWHQMGQTSAKIAAGVLARSKFDQNGVTCNYGIVQLNGGKITLQGYDLTYKKATVVSGSGTSGSNLVTDVSTGWAVNDELVFTPVTNSATNYNESETRFIKTIAGTAITLSATAGGAESGLTYSHTNGYVLNVTRGVLIDTTDTTKAWYCDLNETTTIGNLDFDGCRLETTGSSTANKTNLTFSNLSTELFTADDVVFYRQLGSNGVTFGNNNDVRTYTWLIFYSYSGTGNAGMLFPTSLRNKTFQNCYFVSSQSAGFFGSSTSTATLDQCGAWACGQGSSTALAGFQFTNCSNVTMTDCDAHANRSYGMTLATMPGLTVTDSRFGTLGYNGTADIQINSDSYDTALFDNCSLGSATLVGNYQNAAQGTEIAFNKLNGTEFNHRWYSANGYNEASGPTCTDTTTVQTGHHSVKFRPENTTYGTTWEYGVLARVGYYVPAQGIVQMNAAFYGDASASVTVGLFLPGSATADATYTLPKDGNLNPFNIGATYNGTNDEIAKVIVTAKTATASAYVFAGKLYNGTNPLTAVDTWQKGKPSYLMYPELGDPDAVWAVATSALTTTGTTGKKLVDDLTFGQYLATS